MYLEQYLSVNSFEWDYSGKWDARKKCKNYIEYIFSVIMKILLYPKHPFFSISIQITQIAKISLKGGGKKHGNAISKLLSLLCIFCNILECTIFSEFLDFVLQKVVIS